MQESPTFDVHEVPVTVAESDIDVLDHVNNTGSCKCLALMI